MPIKITTNQKALAARIKLMAEKYEDSLAEIMRDGAYVIEATAIVKAPKKNMKIAQNMFVEEIDPLTYEIGNNLKYAAYQEFGTRFHESLKDIPEELKELAALFIADPLIRASNIPAHPFLYPGLIAGRKHIVQALTDFKPK